MSTQSVKRHCGGTRLSSLRTNPGGFKREGGGVERGLERLVERVDVDVVTAWDYK